MDTVDTWPDQYGPLVGTDLRRLILFKYRYNLEAAGFTSEQIDRILFLRWLRVKRRVEG